MVYRTADLRPTIFGDAADWSAAAAQSNRLAALRSPAASAAAPELLGLSCVTASGSQVYSLQTQLRCPPVTGGAQIVPELIEPVSAAGAPLATHRHEVQAVAAAAGPDAGSGFAASVDASGRAHVARMALLQNGGGDDEEAAPRSSKRARLDGGAPADATAGWWLEPTVDPLGRGALGWAGVAIANGSGASGGGLSVATAHGGSRRLSFYSGTRSAAERTVYTYQHPTDLCFLDAGGTELLAVSASKPNLISWEISRERLRFQVTEGHQLSIWDRRASNAAVQRLSPGGGTPLAAVCRLPGSAADSVACAGHDRIVSIFDVKMWRARSRWNHVSPHAIPSTPYDSQGCR